MKKLLLILTFLTTSLFSFQVDIWQENNNAILNFNKYYDNVDGDKGTNWVAIYKSGDSNNWDNVIIWAWAKDLAHNEAGNHDERVLPLVTDEGNYEVRFFLNNSYDVFATYSYSNGGGNNNNASIGVADKNDNTIIFNSTIANKAWIGIFKKEASNDWHNMKAWSWATSASTTIDISGLDSGDYEARLFYNNSYDVETKVAFIKDGAKNNNQAKLEIKSQTTTKITLNSTDAKQAWIGIYKKGDSNEWENVKAWDWVDNPTTLDISNLASGTYEARLFYNNSYDVEKTLEFTKEYQSLKTQVYLDIKNRYNLDNELSIDNILKIDESKSIIQWSIAYENITYYIISYYELENNVLKIISDLVNIKSGPSLYAINDISKIYDLSIHNNTITFLTKNQVYKSVTNYIYSFDINNFTHKILTKEEILQGGFDVRINYRSIELITHDINGYNIYQSNNKPSEGIILTIISQATGETITKVLKTKYHYYYNRGDRNYFKMEDGNLNIYRKGLQNPKLRLELDISDIPNISIIKEYEA